MKQLLLAPFLLILASGLIAQTPAGAPQPVHLIDRQLALSGMFSDETTQSFIGLDAGDKIILNCWRLSKKGNASISIKDLNRENEIYKRDGFDTLRNETILVPTKGIYVVSLKTGSLLGKDVRLAVDRIPGAHPADKTIPRPLYDTSSVEVLNTTIRAYSRNSPQSSNTVLKINLPPNTTYWTYWIGAGKDAREKMKDFVASCSSIGNLFPSNPLVLYGMKMIPVLPMTTSGASISYHFMDTRNTTAFTSKQQYSSYMFKSSEKITTEYSFIHNNQADLNLGISNESSGMAQDVEVRVVAFIVNPK